MDVNPDAFSRTDVSFKEPRLRFYFLLGQASIKNTEPAPAKIQLNAGTPAKAVQVISHKASMMVAEMNKLLPTQQTRALIKQRNPYSTILLRLGGFL